MAEPLLSPHGRDNTQIDSTANPEVSDLEALIAQATAKYAQKEYKAAAELYSRCAQLQAEKNGEMSTENASLLYSYGRCLYHVAILKSDVLGSRVAGEKKEEGSKQTRSTNEKSALADGEIRVAEEALAVVSTSIDKKTSKETKPYFQFQGDENFDDSEEEDDDEIEERGEGAGEEEDDFQNAFEILDLARVLLQKKVEEEQSNEGNGKTADHSKTIRQLKERLADTHDLQAEISLEGEQFPNAVEDLRAALVLKEELFPSYSSLIAETHYKLSLALEFASVTQQKPNSENVEQTSGAHIDEVMREEAAKEMEAAISCCRLRISREASALESENKASSDDTKRLAAMRKGIDDVKDMVQDMEQRV